MSPRPQNFSDEIEKRTSFFEVGHTSFVDEDCIGMLVS